MNTLFTCVSVGACAILGILKYLVYLGRIIDGDNQRERA
jgi:hypothetical protein